MAQETQEKCKQKQQKNWPLWAIVLTSIATVVFVLLLAYIVLMGATDEKPTFTLSDWVQIVLPIVGAALVVVFAFLGVDRLKNFDERQDKMENEIREELKHRMEQSDRTISEAKDSADKQFDRMEKHIINAALPQAVNNAIEGKISGLQEEFSSRTVDIQNLTARFEEKYNKLEAWFKDIPGLQAVLENTVDWDTVQTNVSWVHTYIAKQFTEMNSPKAKLTGISAIMENINSLVSVICQPTSKITGEADDYHNLSSELARNNQYDLAVNVLKKGLQLFPHNTDLLSGIVLFSTKMGQLDIDAESTLKAIPRELWNWRAFTFYIDSLNLRKITDSSEKVVMAEVNQYIALLPDDERAYMAKYQTLEHYGKHAEAVATLQEAENSLAMTAQCSLALCRIYTMQGEFKKAIHSADRVLLGNAEEQPSANTGAALARRAFALDALVRQEISTKQRSQEDCIDDIKRAIQDYKLSLQLHHPCSGQIATRISLLDALLPSGDKNCDPIAQQAALMSLQDFFSHMKKHDDHADGLDDITDDDY